jgi:hypothetical protein
MSDTTPLDPPNPSDSQELHPAELLAGYVDGSASGEERAAAERHLGSCPRCTAEVALARSARAALLDLPQLDAPGLAGRGIDAFRGTEDVAMPAALHSPSAPRERVRWTRVAWGAGLAAAAALVVVFSLSALFGNNGNPAATQGPAARAPGPVAGPAQGLPPIVDDGNNYTAQTLGSLASRVAKTSPSSSFGSTGRKDASAPDLARAVAILTCLQQGTGLDASARPVYLEVAEYQGTPAYIGAFVSVPPSGSDSKSHLLVYVVGQNGCQPLTVVRQPL